MKKLAFLLVSLCLSGAINAQQTASSSITLDFDKGTISPSEPTINIWKYPSVVLEVKDASGSKDFLFQPVYAEPEPLPESASESLKKLSDVVRRQPQLYFETMAQVPEKDKGEVTKVRDSVSAVGTRLVLNFQVCDGGKCPRAERDTAGGNLFDVYLDLKPRQDYVVNVYEEKKKDAVPRQVIVHVEKTVLELVWSAGFAMPWLRDERLRLDPIAGDESKLRIVSNGQGGIPYRLAAYAHYCFVHPRWLRPACLTGGLATDLPVTGLMVMTGVSLRARPLDLFNSGYLTFGLAYGQRKVLSDDYLDRKDPTVPAGTSASSLLTSRNDFRFFVGISYGFFGGEEKFKGVYQGGSPPK